MSIIITADSSCDLPDDCIAPLPFLRLPLTIIQDGVDYKDGLDCHPQDIYTRVAQGANIPSTSAINISDYYQKFEVLSKDYDAIIHINIGSEISSCHANARMAAAVFPKVHLVDSKNISVGQGLLVLEAARLYQEGKAPAEIAEILTKMADRIEFTFILDQVSYLHKGGRCSGLAALGANLLKLKPVIAVLNGKMQMVRKYRGAFEKVLPHFFADELHGREDIVPELCKLVSTDCPESWVQLSQTEIISHTGFPSSELYTAGCTICSHSGPKALGLAVLRREGT